MIATGKPESPAGRLKVRKVTANSVSLEWNTPYDDGGRQITAYIVEYRPRDVTRWQRASFVDTYTRTCTVSGLQENNEYLFRVSAVNDVGQSEPNETDLPVMLLRDAGWCAIRECMPACAARVRLATCFCQPW